MNDTAQSWACSYESVVGKPKLSRPRPRAMRIRENQPYLAAVPPYIAHRDPLISTEALTLAAEATAEIAHFDASIAATDFHYTEFSPLDTVLLRTESASSSQIEQITTDARALALAAVGKRTDRNARLVSTNAEAMRMAIELSDQLNLPTLLAVHRALLEESNPAIAGQWRCEAVWIGPTGSTPHTASFVPPREIRIPELMADLALFFKRVDVPPLVQAALAHAQFETIHPFADGNGRVGRALVHAMLRQYGVTRRLTLPVSAGLLGATHDYFAALTAYREGNLDPIVTQFSYAAFHATQYGRELVEALLVLHKEWAESLGARRGATAWEALGVIIAQPAITVSGLAQVLHVSFPTAQHVITQLVQAGALVSDNRNSRNRIWTAPEVLRIFDSYSAALRRGR
jgi:Fic family protein